MLTWVHFGDLHASDEDNWRSLTDLDLMIDEVNARVAGFVDFAFFPGDNANHGTVEQYRRIRASMDRLRLPRHVIAGDHDFEPGTLSHFYDGLGARRAPYGIRVGGRPCLFLDIVSEGSGGPDFKLGEQQDAWLRSELERSLEATGRPVVFMHAFPEDLGVEGDALARLFAECDVACVDTGHTHYNEALNDGAVIYIATRSTGQLEEGAVGYSLHAVDGSVVSWRFKECGGPWPFVMITSPSDRRFVTDPTQRDQIPASTFAVRAKIFGGDVSKATLAVDGAAVGAMSKVHDEASVWSARVAGLADGLHDVRVEAVGHDGVRASDTITVKVSSSAQRERVRADRDLGRHSRSIGRWEERGLMGTQLGPNRNGRKW